MGNGKCNINKISIPFSTHSDPITLLPIFSRPTGLHPLCLKTLSSSVNLPFRYHSSSLSHLSCSSLESPSPPQLDSEGVLYVLLTFFLQNATALICFTWICYKDKSTGPPTWTAHAVKLPDYSCCADFNARWGLNLSVTLHSETWPTCRNHSNLCHTWQFMTFF